LCYTRRICDEGGGVTLPLAQSLHEVKYFSYAAQLFAKCSQHRGGVFDLALHAFRNYICAAAYDDAAELITSGALLIEDRGSLQKLYAGCLPASQMDPTSPFRKDFKQKNEACQCVINAVKQVATRF
jgi:hypothetical protein